MSTSAPERSSRARHRVGLTVCVEGTLLPEVQERAVRAFAALAAAFLLDEPMGDEVPVTGVPGSGLLAAAGSR